MQSDDYLPMAWRKVAHVTSVHLELHIWAASR